MDRRRSSRRTRPGLTRRGGECRGAIAGRSWKRIPASRRAQMRAVRRMLGSAKTAVLVWSMGVTQHEFGEDNVRAIVNLGLTRGFVGRERCGLMPIRGHSGVQGGAEMGAYATAFPGGVPVNAENAAQTLGAVGFRGADRRRADRARNDRCGARGELDVLFRVGGNFLEALPDPDYVRERAGDVPLRVHQDIVLSTPDAGRSGGTVRAAAGRDALREARRRDGDVDRAAHHVQPGDRRAAIGEARPKWREFYRDCPAGATRARGEFAFSGTQAVRDEIAEVVPMYQGIETLKATGDQVQYGGPHLCAGWHFPTADGKAHFAPVPLPNNEIPAGLFAVSTRRGKQFNTMVHAKDRCHHRHR